MCPETAKPVPRATFRLQFTKDFGFARAADLAPYLAKLGISHVYASPYLRARPGSTHCYDIVSHTELNPELGTLKAFDRMVAAFRENGAARSGTGIHLNSRYRADAGDAQGRSHGR